MAPKDKKEKEKKEKKGAKGAKEESKEAAKEVGEDETPADRLRKEGIIATFAASSKTLHRNVRDISVSNLTVTFHGVPLVEEAELTLNYGNRYGYIGRNGCGKSTFMRVIGSRCFPIPDGIDIFHLKEEIEATEMTAKEAVMSVDVERAKLEAEADSLNDFLAGEGEGNEEAMDRLNQVYERLEEMDAATAEARCSLILAGLGFTPETQNKKTKDFSGGWRMRIALARALFIQPTLLLLDEPTNHLDMEAVVWLEDYLSKWDKILFMVSHSQDFMNSVCTHIVHHTKQKRLMYYSGNYDAFIKTREEKEEEQEKRFKAEQDQIKHMKEYVARFGQGNAKMARQAQSKEKVLDKMLRSGLTDKVEADKPMDFKFQDPGKLAPPVLQCNDITFGYPGCEILYRNVDFGLDLDSRVALVGPNGAGKSTLLKVCLGELMPVTGSVRPHVHLRIAKFSQHFIDVLDLEATPLDYFMTIWPDLTREDARKFLGRYGISGPCQTQIMGNLSDGQKSRVVLAKMAKENPHILFLDEPTNHLDMESIDSLAKAINQFAGGMVLVSHDMRLISQVAKEIWMVDNKTVTRFVGEINDFKMHLRREMQRNNLIAGDAKSAAPTRKVSEMFVPLSANPLKSGPAFTGAIAPPAPPTLKKQETEEEMIMKTRLEMAELAIQRQRQRQAAEAAATEGIPVDLFSPPAPPAEEENEDERIKREEKEAAKARKKAEKEAKAAFEKQEEEERIQRKAEKEVEFEQARLLREQQLKAQEEFIKQKEAKKAAERIEQELEAKKMADLLDKRRAEHLARKRARAEARAAEEDVARKEVEAKVLADPWTQQQQLNFEKALLQFTPNVDKTERWTKVATAVAGKTKNQCLARYKYLKEHFRRLKHISTKA